MCGIAGFVGDFPPHLLIEMNRLQRHRGPDGEDYYHNAKSRVGLAHTRLAIIDPSLAGRQPMWSQHRRFVIVFNGEIYNYRSLRNELSESGYEFHSDTDTEAILGGYARWGEDVLGRLNGIFALALWDVEREVLLLARDGIGVKPLYYVTTPDGVLFASEIKALLACPTICRHADIEALAHYLVYLWAPAPKTPFKGIQKLEPGMALHVGKHGVMQRWSHYDLPTGSVLLNEEISPADAARKLRDCVRDAVERQLVADVPVGAFLSGGLDSSSVVAFARRATSKTFPCFTIDFDAQAGEADGFVADLPYARKVAKAIDVDLQVVHVGPDMIDDLDLMISHLEEPTADPAALHVYRIASLARKAGVKVLLSGTGGDDLLSGYRRHLAYTSEWLWAWAGRPARCALRAVSQALPLNRRLQRLFAYADREPRERLVSYFWWCDPRIACRLLMLPDTGNADGTRFLLESLAQAPESSGKLDQMLFLEQRHFLADHNLHYTDKMSMAAGVETRVPLLDPAVVSLAATMPESFKQRKWVGKWLFKKAMEGILPQDVIWRPKTGFGVPLRRWLRSELRPVLDHFLEPGSLRRQGFFDVAAVGRLREEHDSDRRDHAYLLFAILCVSKWADRFGVTRS